MLKQSTSVMKRSSERFVDLFSERIKFSRDKYAVLRVRCYKYVRGSLKSEEARKLVTIVAKMVILYRLWLFLHVHLECTKRYSLQWVIEIGRNGKAKMLGSNDVRNIIAKEIAAIDVMEEEEKEINLPGHK